MLSTLSPMSRSYDLTVSSILRPYYFTFYVILSSKIMANSVIKVHVVSIYSELIRDHFSVD